MEAKQLTTGGMVTALLVTLSMLFLMSGVGYYIYLDMIAPIMITLIHLKCGSKVSLMTAISSLCIVFFVQGSLLALIYLVQAFIFGEICGYLLKKTYGLLEDMMLASLGGCLVTLMLDRGIAILSGVSILDDLPAFLSFGLSEEYFLVVYYIAIAAVPIVSLLLVYLGSLFIGRYLHLLDKKQLQKYKMVRNYPYLAPLIFCQPKTIKWGSIWAFVCFKAGHMLPKGYLKAFFLCSGIILAYFILQDLVKFMTTYVFVHSGKKRSVILLMHVGMIIGLIYQFKLMSFILAVLAIVLDSKSSMRAEKQLQLQGYLKNHPKLR